MKSSGVKSKKRPNSQNKRNESAANARNECDVARSEYPSGDRPLRVSHYWDWNPIRWSWFDYKIPVKTLKSDGNSVLEVEGTLVLRNRGPYHSTVVYAA